MEPISMYAAIAAAVVLAAAIVFTAVRANTSRQKVRIAEETAKHALEEAKKEADRLRKEAVLETKDQQLKLRAEFDRETKERKAELSGMEKRLTQREEKLENQERGLESQFKDLKVKEDKLKELKEKMDQTLQQQIKELEKVAALSKEDAKSMLLKNVEKEAEMDMAKILKAHQEQLKKEVDKKAIEMLATAIQRCGVDHVVETMTSVVELPSDEMKGRIIGREGRNIRVFETLTGVDLIVDDTPEAVILSSFDPLRRETAKLTLQKLVVDGRIHPARVEEMYEKSKKEIKAIMWEYGEKAAIETGVHGLPAVIIQLLGRLHFRTSYGQNVLQHSIEVAHLAGMLASELEVNVKLAKRAGLLHDLGKAIDREVEGTHVKLGVMFAQKAGESPEVLHAMEAHHGDVEPKTIEAVLVQVADAISAARPGARRDTLEAYVKRLEKLENVAKGFEGVEKTYAIQAGREIRIVVQPDKVDDLKAAKLAHDVARKIEAELQYPGEVKVMVIRETRATDIAK